MFAGPAAAICNVIPGVVTEQRGALGALNRPFASPGDVVGIEVRAAICDDESAGFSPVAGDHVVTVLFTPPGAGADHAVVLSDDCASHASEVASCNTLLGGIDPDERASCIEVNGPGEPGGLFLRPLEQGRKRLFFRFPDTDTLFGGAADQRTLSGPAKIVVTAAGAPLQCGLATSRCADNLGGGNLLACVDEIYKLDGSCRTASPDNLDPRFAHFTALPPPNVYSQVCTDPAPPEGPCVGGAPEIRYTTDLDGNALIPWDYTDVLIRKDDVPIARIGKGTAFLEDFTGSGNPLQLPRKGFLSSHAPEGLRVPPIFTALSDPDANASLFGTIDAPRGIMRLARRSSTFSECVGGPDAGRPCVQGFGACSGGGTCQPASCVGGSNDGLVCGGDLDCPGGECGPSLFDFRDRYDGGTGPVILPNFQYAISLRESVPLEGLNESAEVFAFVVREDIEGKDLNGDGDTTDFIVTMADKKTGDRQKIGAGATVGRAVSRFDDGTFSYPSVSLEGGVVTMMESEAREGLDSNNDGDLIDYVLRGFSLGGGASDLFAGAGLSGLTLPYIDGQPVVVSDGLVFFLGLEADNLAQVTRRMSVDSSGLEANGPSFEPFVSGFGRHVAFTSDATNLVAGDSNGLPDVFVRDRNLDFDLLLDENDATTQTVRVNVSTGGAEANGASGNPAMDEEGRHIAFDSVADNLVASDTNGSSDVFVRQRDIDFNFLYDQPGTVATTRISVSTSGAQATALPCVYPGPIAEFLGSYRPSVTSSYETTPTTFQGGRWVVFESFATDLVAGDTNGACGAAPGLATGMDVFVHSRDLNSDFLFDQPGDIRTVRISLNSDGTEASGGNSFAIGRSGSNKPSISNNGRYVAFESELQLHPDDDNSFIDVYLHDRDADGNGIYDETCLGCRSWVLASRAVAGQTNDGDTRLDHLGRFGRFVIMTSTSTQLVEDDTNGVSDVFAYDRLTDLVTRESLNAAFGQANGASRLGSLFPDDRLIHFMSEADNLVADDINGVEDRFGKNRLLGAIVRASGSIVGDLPYSTANFGNQPTFTTPLQIVPADTSAIEDIYTVTVDETNPNNNSVSQDLNGDGDIGDALLLIVDVRDNPGQLFTLATAVGASVDNGAAALLSPEADSIGNSFTPPINNADLNGDGDVADLVVQFWAGRAAGSTTTNLGRAATEVHLSSDVLVALSSEADEFDASQNGDGDTNDLVVNYWQRPGLTFTNLGVAADQVQVEGTRIAYRVPEADENATDRSGDNDDADRVMALHDTSGPGNVPIKDASNRDQPAEDFVLASELLAFSTNEFDLCDAGAGGTCSALVGCALAACDLNGDGDCCDAGLQVFDLATGGQGLVNTGSSVQPCNQDACDPSVPYRVAGKTVRFLTNEADESRDLNDDGDQLDTLVQVYSLESNEVEVIGEVATVPPGEETGGLSINPIEDQSSEEEPELSLAFLTTGVCTEDLLTACASSANCGGGEFCDANTFTCKRQAGTCRVGIVDDCAPSETCEETFAVVSAPDTDGDEVLDTIDNCPQDFNLDQLDTDGDGVGDVCDIVVCGNGVLDPIGNPEEECDDGNFLNGDGCTNFCRNGGCFGDVTLDNDIDQLDIDAFDTTKGCFPCASNCRPECDFNGDGLVNNIDSLELQSLVGTQCVVSLGGEEEPPPPPEPEPEPEPDPEPAPRPRGCGLGFELAPFALLLMAAARRRRSRTRASA